MLSCTVAQLLVSNGSDGKSAMTKSLNWTTLPLWLASNTPPDALGGKCPLKEVTWTPSRKTETSDFRTSSVTWIHLALRGGPCGQEPIWDSYQFNRPCWISPVWKHGLPLAPTLGKYQTIKTEFPKTKTPVDFLFEYSALFNSLLIRYRES